MDCGPWVGTCIHMMIVVTLIIVCSVAAIAVIILIGLIIFTQKHRENKRKRLEGSLVRNDAAAI